jgi:hypothetical protein
MTEIIEIKTIISVKSKSRKIYNYNQDVLKKTITRWNKPNNTLISKMFAFVKENKEVSEEDMRNFLEKHESKNIDFYIFQLTRIQYNKNMYHGRIFKFNNETKTYSFTSKCLEILKNLTET